MFSCNFIKNNNSFIALSRYLSIYLELSKWRVTCMMLVTAAVGMQLASQAGIQLRWVLVLGGIGLIACAAASLNHLLDRQRDGFMARTQRRPLPQQRISSRHALLFAVITCLMGSSLLLKFGNLLTLQLTLLSFFGYAFVYTLFLKRFTSQNIVIGGLAGATPPLLGWTTVTHQIDAGGLILLMIIFAWTPPHFWSLAIARYDDYKKIGLPMLPVTHGIPFTKQQIFLYTLLLCAISLLPFCVKMSGWFYLIGVLILNSGFVIHVLILFKETKSSAAIKTFHYSNFYLLMLFACLLIDHSL